MLEIKFDVTKLNHDERQDLASFILGWPERIEHATLHSDNPFAPEDPPLPAGATAAPISAGVEASRIVLETGVTTSNILPIPAFIPPAPLSANVAETAAPPQTSPVELDSEGLPWDSRIHSSSRGKIANGTWKLMRGGDPVRVEAIKRELRALMVVPVAGVAVTAEGIISHNPPNPPVNMTNPKSHYLIDQPGAVLPPLPESPAPTSIRHGFVDFIEDITQRLVSKKLTQADILKACTDAGIAAPNLLATSPDLIPQVARALDAIV